MIENKEIKNLFGDTKILPSEINNPFNFDSITAISIRYYKSSWDNGRNFRGSVDFENGLTRGTQDFNGESLSDVFKQIHDFCDKLNNLKK